MAFEVPALPYDYGALEPHIDEQTMRVHHDKHHQAYVDNANAALDGTPLADKPVEHVLTNLEALPEDKQTAVRNNAGGHVNHSMFWEIMGPDGGGEPSGAVGDAISAVWGSFGELKKLVNETGVKRGSYTVNVTAGLDLKGKAILFQRYSRLKKRWVQVKRVVLATSAAGAPKPAVVSSASFTAKAPKRARVRAAISKAQAAPCYVKATSNVVRA